MFCEGMCAQYDSRGSRSVHGQRHQAVSVAQSVDRRVPRPTAVAQHGPRYDHAMVRRPSLRVLDSEVEFVRLKADFAEARQSGKYPSLRDDDPCAGCEASLPLALPMIDLDVDHWRERGYTLEHALRVSVMHGLLTEMPSVDVVRRVLADEGDEVDVFHYWFGLMQRSGRALMFDTETGTFPNRHDALILEEFGRLQPRVFRPTDAAECWHAEPAPSAGHYDVAFRHGTHWYHFVARDLSDWFDVDAVVHAISAAMADAGVAESFLRISTDSQGAYFLFATPRQVEAFTSSLRRPHDKTTGVSFRDLPAELPTVPFFPSATSVEREVRFLDLACRLGKGQRVLVVDTPEGHAHTPLMAMFDTIARQHPDLSVRLIFALGAKPAWQGSVPQNMAFIDLAQASPADQPAALETQLSDAHALLTRGRDVLLFVSWLSRLGGSTGEMTPLDLSWFKVFFGSGRNCGAGSLTLVASSPNGPEHPMDRLLIQELGRMANAELWFSAEPASHAAWPPVDFSRSYTQREDLLLSSDERIGRGALKAKTQTLAPADVPGYIWNQLGLFPDTKDFLSSLAAASRVPDPPATAKGRGFWHRLLGRCQSGVRDRTDGTGCA